MTIPLPAACGDRWCMYMITSEPATWVNGRGTSLRRFLSLSPGGLEKMCNVTSPQGLKLDQGTIGPRGSIASPHAGEDRWDPIGKHVARIISRSCSLSAGNRQN